MTVSTGLSVGVVGTAQAAPEKYFELRSQGSDNCLSVDGRGPGGPGADLADVVQYHCEGSLNQHWLQVDAGSGQFELRAQNSNKCLSVDGRGPGGPGADLADVVQYHCEGSLNQHWLQVDAGSGQFELRAQNSNKCLSVDGRGPGGPGADLANVVQYHCEGGALNQHWRMVA
jgi:Ricin-type beta-trefoil lectin domain